MPGLLKHLSNTLPKFLRSVSAVCVCVPTIGVLIVLAKYSD